MQGPQDVGNPPTHGGVVLFLLHSAVSLCLAPLHLILCCFFFLAVRLCFGRVIAAVVSELSCVFASVVKTKVSGSIAFADSL